MVDALSAFGWLVAKVLVAATLWTGVPAALWVLLEYALRPEEEGGPEAAFTAAATHPPDGGFTEGGSEGPSEKASRSAGERPSKRPARAGTGRIPTTLPKHRLN